MVEKKPEPTIDIMTSAVASADFNNAIESQRDTFAGRLTRVCLWAKSRRMPNAPC